MRPWLSGSVNEVSTVAKASGFLLTLLLAACQATAPSSAPTAAATATFIEDPSITPVPGGQSLPPPATSEFVPPSPGCPSPAGQVAAPAVSVSVGDGPPIVALLGAATLMTCTTTSASDTVGDGQPNGLEAHPGDRLRLSLPVGWQFLHWEGFDGPSVGEGGNVWPGVDTPERPVQIDLPTPNRTGESLAWYTLWVISADGRVVGQLEIRFLITIS